MLGSKVIKAVEKEKIYLSSLDKLGKTERILKYIELSMLFAIIYLDIREIMRQVSKKKYQPKDSIGITAE